MASVLSDAHIRSEARLRTVTTAAVTAIWQSLPGYDRANVDQWLSGVVPVVLSAQRRSVTLTDAFLARAVGRAPLGVNPDGLVGAGVRKGTPPETVYHRPFVTLWAALGEGVLFADAVHAGLARAVSTAAMDVQLSMRATANAVQEADDGIYGYQRVADGGACEFCQEVDGAYLKSADAMPLHNHCGCGIEPLTEPRSPSPVPETVAVHEHGELGPLLADPTHEFTSASDF